MHCPWGGWCWLAGLLGLLGVRLAGCNGAQEVLVPDRPHSLALMSGDLWFSAVAGWWGGGVGGTRGGAEGRVAPWAGCSGLFLQEPWCPGVWVEDWEGKKSPWWMGKWGGATLAGSPPHKPVSLRTGRSLSAVHCTGLGLSHAVGAAHGVGSGPFSGRALFTVAILWTLTCLLCLITALSWWLGGAE